MTLIVASHPDDEILGCGAVISQSSDTVNLLLLGGGRDNTILNSTHEAAEIVGIGEISCLGFPDQKYDAVPFLDIIVGIEECIEKYQPDIIYTHHRLDLNKDHRIAYNAVITACRPLPGMGVKTIYSFETISSTEWSYPYAFSPNVFVDVTNSIRAKTKAMQFYGPELREDPHPRSTRGIITLAQYRGQQVGYEFAEAFELVRQLK